MEGLMNVHFTGGALPYAERLGWKVLLLAPGWKVPYFPKGSGGRGVHDATADVAQLREWGGSARTATSRWRVVQPAASSRSTSIRATGEIDHLRSWLRRATFFLRRVLVSGRATAAGTIFSKPIRA